MFVPVYALCSVQFSIWRCTISSFNSNKNNIPVTTGANVTRSKQFRKYLSNTPRKHEFKKLQKTAVLDTGHEHRKILV